MFEEHKKVGIEYIQVIFNLQDLIEAIRRDSSILLLTGPRRCLGYYFSEFVVDKISQDDIDHLIEPILDMSNDELINLIEDNPDAINYYFTYNIEKDNMVDWEVEIDCENWFTPNVNTFVMYLEKFLKLYKEGEKNGTMG